jgi:hypothetical protein
VRYKLKADRETTRRSRTLLSTLKEGTTRSWVINPDVFSDSTLIRNVTKGKKKWEEGIRTRLFKSNFILLYLIKLILPTLLFDDRNRGKKRRREREI